MTILTTLWLGCQTVRQGRPAGCVAGGRRGGLGIYIYIYIYINTYTYMYNMILIFIMIQIIILILILILILICPRGGVRRPAQSAGPMAEGARPYKYIYIYIYMYIYSLFVYIHMCVYIATFWYFYESPTPKTGIRKGGIRPSNHLTVTFKSLKSSLRFGSPFSDPPLGDGERVVTITFLSFLLILPYVSSVCLFLVIRSYFSWLLFSSLFVVIP